MPSPFPGMDPYLEHPSTWPNVHHRVITAIAISLAPHLRPKYRVVVEEAIYQTDGQDSLLVGIPDTSVLQSSARITESTATNVAVASPVQPFTIILPLAKEIKQGYLEVRDLASSEVVTAIEVLSPANKREGKGRKQYQAKREMILASGTNLVEIDLLRQYKPMLTLRDTLEKNYRILAISESQQRPKASLYAFNLANPIPPFPLPLRPEDENPIVNLQLLLDEIYYQSSYDLVIDYSQKPIPPLSKVDRIWADELLKDKGLR